MPTTPLAVQTSVTDPDSHVTHYTYDADGNRTSLTDPDGNTTSWTYDALGRVTAETDPLGHAAYYQYDADGKSTQKTDRDGRVTDYVYDNLGRRIEEDWMDGSTAVRTITYEYDADGEMSYSTDSAGQTGIEETGYNYDNLGRLTSTCTSIDEHGYAGHPLVLSYDAAGTAPTATSGAATAYYGPVITYDALNRPTAI